MEMSFSDLTLEKNLDVKKKKQDKKNLQNKKDDYLKLKN
jgi:hypothetical protein